MTTTTSDPLLAAINRLLAKPHHRCEPHTWHGRCKDLFHDLVMHDDLFYKAVDRPHDAADLRQELRKRAVDLHKLGIIVTLEGQLVTLDNSTK